MAKATTKRAATTQKSAAKSSPDSFLGLPLKTWVASAHKPRASEARSGARGFVYAFGKRNAKLERSLLKSVLAKWQLDLLAKNDVESVHYQGPSGPVWILRAPEKVEASAAALEKSGYARFRDLAGGVVSQLSAFKLDKLVVEAHALSDEEERAMLIGFELASYSYAENRDNPNKSRKKLPALLLKEAASLDAAAIRSAAQLAFSMNIARHLVNVPGGELDPRTYADAVVGLFDGVANVEVEVWQGEKLRQERMNLLLAVGGAAAQGPRLVHISYRPTGGKKTSPVAIVGKGVTFDSGGLDIKPSSGMRWMKKDMGGSAAAVGLAYWAASTGLELPLDVYLSLAENAVSAGSFRPGDVITARSGTTVEIGNTDAEGRLVLADAIDVAVTREEKPQALIDLATLTGAIKVGLGAEIAGLFSNNDSLADEIEDAGRRTGDLSWRMPLFQPYKSMLRSTFADVNNCSDGGFGGAITAALFLQMFVKDVPWAHLDIYAWKDGAGGAYSESGGSGQPIQAISDVLSRIAAQAAEEAS